MPRGAYKEHPGAVTAWRRSQRAARGCATALHGGARRGKGRLSGRGEPGGRPAPAGLRVRRGPAHPASGAAAARTTPKGSGRGRDHVARAQGIGPDVHVRACPVLRRARTYGAAQARTLPGPNARPRGGAAPRHPLTGGRRAAPHGRGQARVRDRRRPAGLYKDLSYVTKLGYTVGEMGERILVWVIIEGDNDDDEFFDYSMTAVRKAREFSDMMPAGMRDRYEVVPIVSDPDEGALSYFDTITAVIDR